MITYAPFCHGLHAYFLSESHVEVCLKSFLWPVQEVGQKIKDALHAQNAAPVVVELDWKESVLHEDDRYVAYIHSIA